MTSGPVRKLAPLWTPTATGVGNVVWLPQRPGAVLSPVPPSRSVGDQYALPVFTETRLTVVSDRESAEEAARRSAVASEIENLVASVETRDEEVVRQFLSFNDDLLPIVDIVRRRIAGAFAGDASGVLLWVNNDPASEDAYLSIGVVTTLPPREAIDRLHLLDEEWLREMDSFVRDHVLLTLVMKQ